MRTIEGFPYAAVQFTKDGAVHDRGEADALQQTVAESGCTDLLVLSHGWNNTMAQAERLYTDLLGLLRGQLTAGRVGGLGDRRFAALGLLWPSKKFAPSELTASGAAGTASTVSHEELARQLRELAELIDEPAATAEIEKARDLIPQLEDSAAARREFADLLRAAATAPASPSAVEDADASTDLFALPGDAVMSRLARPVLPAPPSRTGGGGAASIGSAAGGVRNFFAGGPLGAGRNLANFLTYYKMKERAGTVGSAGAYEVLAQAQQSHPGLRLHLAGHSFGARLVTAATAGPPGRPPLRPASLTLLQAAFSHYSFAENYDGGKDGAFLRVVKERLVSGPILITHTVNDVAVGIAYPLASLLRNQVANGLGDKNDRFGGLGRNGAQKTANVQEGDLLAVGGTYAFEPGRVHNLRADQFISDHGAVATEQTAYALLTAIASTPTG